MLKANTHYQEVWVAAASSAKIAFLDFPTRAEAVSYRQQLYRWRKRNPELCSEDILAITISIISGLDGTTSLCFRSGVLPRTLRFED